MGCILGQHDETGRKEWAIYYLSKKFTNVESRYPSVDKLLFQTKQRLQMLFSWNQSINIVYPNKNYPFVSASREKKLDSIHGRSSSYYKDKLWFQTKRRLQMLFFSRNQHINIMYPIENYPFFLAPCTKKQDSIPGWNLSHFKDKL